MTILLPWVICAIQTVVIIVLAGYVYRFAHMILGVITIIEDSVDVLGRNHDVMSEILSTPVFSDSSEVKRVISAIENSRDSIYHIAKALESVDGREDDNEGQEEDSKESNQEDDQKDIKESSKKIN